MISQLESILHLSTAAAISTTMLGAGMGLIGPAAPRRLRWAWLACGGVGVATAMIIAYAELDLTLNGSSFVRIGLGVAIGLAIAAVSIAAGLRGHRIGDHPYCRRCGFDLTGRPETSVVCGECGAPLDAPRAIVCGLLVRRRTPLLIGAFVAIVSLAVGMSIFRTATAGGGRIEWIRYKPLGSLVNGALATVAASSSVQSERGELFRRLADSELDDASIRRVIDAGAAAPNGESLAESFAIEAWASGQLDVETIRALVRRQAAIVHTLPAQAAPDRIPFALEVKLRWTTYLNRNPGVSWSLAVANRVDTINGVRVPPESIVTLQHWPVEALPSTQFGDLYRFAAPLPAGPATVEVRMTLTVTLESLGRSTIVEIVPVVARGRIMIVPGFERRLLDDGNREAQFNGGADATIVRNPDGRHATIRYSLYSTTGDWATFVGDAFAIGTDGVERPLGAVFINAWGTSDVDLASLPETPLTILLRPRPGRGADFLEAMQTYQHEIKISPEHVTLE